MEIWEFVKRFQIPLGIFMGICGILGGFRLYQEIQLGRTFSKTRTIAMEKVCSSYLRALREELGKLKPPASEKKDWSVDDLTKTDSPIFSSGAYKRENKCPGTGKYSIQAGVPHCSFHGILKD